jgi:coenzyme F420-0:L-glutamate ligase/coenzyme F420-1:gamma-L-glutamate ligase
MTLTLTSIPNIPLIRPGDNLADILATSLHTAKISLRDGDILVLTQKIVSKAEGRDVNLSSITPTESGTELAARSQKDPRLCDLILRESRQVLRVRHDLIIVEHRLGFVCANAGIDHSNVGSQDSPLPSVEGAGVRDDDWVLLLPENPDHSADQIRRQLEATSGKRLGIAIIDSHGRAWRMGTVGVVIGFSGLPGLVDLRGEPDLIGHKLLITQVGAGDELAAAASLVMGQAAEGTPAVHVRGFPYPLREGSLKELLRPKEQDLFR